MPDSPKYYKWKTTVMTSKNHGDGIPPPPITALTLEQEFQLKKIEDLLDKADREDMKTVFMALQQQCYVLQNNIKNLIQEW